MALQTCKGFFYARMFDYSYPYVVNREILRLAIPNILSNISVPLLSTVDTALMGNVSPLHLGAIGLGGMIFNFIYWNFGFLRMGTTGMTAQAYGADDQDEIAYLLLRVCMVAIIVAGLLVLFSGPIIWLATQAMNVQPEHLDLVTQYVSTRIWDAPATLLLYGLLGWFFGMQDAVVPLVITVIINILNIILSIYFVKVQGMDVVGVALGTVIAQYIGVALCITALIWKYRSYIQFDLVKSFDKEKLLGFFKVNSDLFIRTICLSSAFFFFYRESSGYGEVLLAVNVIIQQFLSWLSYGVDGIAYAAESLVGKYTGANQPKKTTALIKRLLGWGLGFALVYSIIYGIWYEPLVHIFNDNAKVAAVALDYRWWAIAFPVVGFACYIWDGIYVGLTASKAMRNSMLLSLLVYLASYYLCLPYFGSDAIWIALAIFLGIRGVLLTVMYWKRGLAVA